MSSSGVFLITTDGIKIKEIKEELKVDDYYSWVGSYVDLIANTAAEAKIQPKIQLVATKAEPKTTEQIKRAGKTVGATVGIEGIPALEFQAKKEKRDLEMSERMSNATTVDVIPELYEKIRVPGDNILKSKLVEVQLYKAGNGDCEPKLFHTTRIKVKHGLIVIKDENGPEGLKVIPAKGQFFEFNRWKPHKSWKAADKKDTYDPMVMRLEG